jgi:hypothetical protein
VKIVEQCLAAGMAALFRRCPELSGFTVQQSGQIFVGDVTVNSLAGSRHCGELASEINAALLELLDDCPDARGLLRARTFARAFH